MAEPTQPARPRLSRRTRRLLAADLVLLAVLIAILAVRHYTPRALPRNFAVVQAGRLCRSGQPTADQLARVIRQYGIRTVLNLRNPDKDPDYVADEPTAQAHGAHVVRLPISSTQPLSPEQLATLQQVYADPASGPILVHCEAGHARTGVAVAIYRIEQQGWDPDAAVREMVAAGYPVRPEKDAMFRLLQQWQAPPDAARPAGE